jgi:hypothetical protein
MLAGFSKRTGIPRSTLAGPLAPLTEEVANLRLQTKLVRLPKAHPICPVFRLLIAMVRRSFLLKQPFLGMGLGSCRQKSHGACRHHMTSFLPQLRCRGKSDL